MRITTFVIILGLMGPISAIAQEKQQDDVIQHKDGTLIVGKILTVTATGIEMQLRAGGRITLDFKNLAPYSAYRVKEDRIDPNSAQAHFELGEWCLANGLYSPAAEEFEKAAFLDKELAAKAKEKKEEAFNEDARTKFEEAKRLIAAKDYDAAEKLLSLLLSNYKDTPWAKEAQGEITKVTEEIKKENETRKKQLEDKLKAKAEAQAKKGEEAGRASLQQATDAMEDAKKLWEEGLEWDGKANLTKADRAFKTAEARLLSAKHILEPLSKSGDANVAKSAAGLDKEIDAWLLRTYYRLGRMWAVELNYPEANAWLNRGLKLAPDDHLLNEVLLTLTQMEMRKRAAGAKY
ncbi:MAG: hypothetical protein HYY16_06265 [Planctomycetes bacterium]|nr:hypothetical protein [Planctomycetota bacterium]